MQVLQIDLLRVLVAMEQEKNLLQQLVVLVVGKGKTSYKVTCTSCSGSGTISKNITCTHGKNEQHYHCNTHNLNNTEQFHT